MSEYLTVSQAAQFAEKTPKTVYRWIHLGLRPGYELRRKRGWLVRREELEQFLQDVVPLEREEAQR